MERIEFKCTLLSDVVLSQNSATEGNKKSIDFIPGNNFLGIVAGALYKDADSDCCEKLDATGSYMVFHSGHVRFGDANPSIGNVRGLKIPCSMFHPKQQKESECCYIHHLITDNDAVKPLQLKQCRNGFYTFENNTANPIEVEKSFAIKSAYDSESRRSKDECLYGYESLSKGLVLFFDIELDDDVLAKNGLKEKIINSLVGKKYIGRSRTAQYGAVVIERMEKNYDETCSCKKGFSLGGENYVSVYADGRLIFFDDNGRPTFTPSPCDLGVIDPNAEIDWGKSQIRTFQYAPWNFKRQSFDTDRCGIEKGSVFIVKTMSAPENSQYVGKYRNEGFGKVIYNPSFLNAELGLNGIASFKILGKNKNKENKVQSDYSSPLIKNLYNRKIQEERNKCAFDFVNKFVDDNKPKFKDDVFASQWGSIRSLAMIESDGKVLMKNIDSFLDHGIAKDKWEVSKRKETLDKFMKDMEADLQNIMINLASQMAKYCKKEENNE